MGRGSNQARLLRCSNSCQGEYVFKSRSLLESFGVPSSEGAKREQLAFLMDEGHVACVPPTFYVDFTQFGLGVGSVQHYEASTAPLERDRFHMKDESLQDDLRIIRIFNLMILNLDAFSHNILITDRSLGARRCISIDHGYSLPERLAGGPPRGDLCGEAPFSEKERLYIRSLSQERTLALLTKHKIHPDAIQMQQAMLQTLKAAVETPGVTLFHLSTLFYGKRREPREFVSAIGGYGAMDLMTFSDSLVSPEADMCAILSAKAPDERNAAIKKALRAC
ncbi:MAG: hypothetical protein HYX48_02015 [Chlamydiales bacterium]|nr:hypothetical protein [Chlamydiales bacterium]